MYLPQSVLNNSIKSVQILCKSGYMTQSLQRLASFTLKWHRHCEGMQRYVNYGGLSVPLSPVTNTRRLTAPRLQSLITFSVTLRVCLSPSHPKRKTHVSLGSHSGDTFNSLFLNVSDDTGSPGGLCEIREAPVWKEKALVVARMDEALYSAIKQQYSLVTALILCANGFWSN